MRIQVQLQSSSLRSASYDPDSMNLEITFANGRTYSYELVDDDTFNGLRDAPSPGSYFNQNIRDKF